jgi:hypothetical protein
MVIEQLRTRERMLLINYRIQRDSKVHQVESGEVSGLKKLKNEKIRTPIELQNSAMQHADVRIEFKSHRVSSIIMRGNKIGN